MVATIFFFIIIAIIASPLLIKIFNDLKKSSSEKERDAEKAAADQDRREDEGAIITGGRIIFGNKLFDNAQKNKTLTEEAKRIDKFRKKKDDPNFRVKVTKENLKTDIEAATNGTLTFRNGKIIDVKTGKVVKTKGLLQSLPTPEKSAEAIIVLKNKQQSNRRRRRSVFF